MKNWTIKEAVEVINAGTDLDAIKEIAKHFPMFFLAVARNDVNALTQMMGDRFTVRRLVVPQDAADADAEDTDDGEAPAPAESADYSAMPTKDLMKLCDQRGLKVPHYGKNKQFYIDALTGDGGASAEEAPAKAKHTPPSRKAKKAEPEAEEVEEDEDEDADPYAGMAAPDLYKECKSRGIKAAAKKPAKYYIDLLKKADAEADAEAEDDGGWDDEEEEAPTPKANKGTKKSKAAKEDDDDDGDWDI